MNVLGTNIPDEALKAGVAAMLHPFKAADIETAMRPAISSHMRSVLPECKEPSISETVMRAADRLIQKQKKAKAIHFNQLTRTWVKT